MNISIAVCNCLFDNEQLYKVMSAKLSLMVNAMRAFGLEGRLQ